MTIDKTTALALLAAGLILAAPAYADGSDRRCSLRDVAGAWLFATDVGQVGEGDSITAMGTMNIHRDGTLDGRFDVTRVGQTSQTTFFFPGITYVGSITVNRDCTGTLSFTTGVGTSRTDSILILSSKRIQGMSQDVGNLWTYRVWRIGSHDRDDD